MASKWTSCGACGEKIIKGLKACPYCGAADDAKPFHKRPWFIAAVVLIVLGYIGHQCEDAQESWRPEEPTRVESPHRVLDHGEAAQPALPPDPPPPMADDAEGLAVSTDALKESLVYAGLWKDSAWSTDRARFLTAVGEALTNSRGTKTTVDEDRVDWLKRKKLFDPAMHAHGYFLRTGEYPTEIAEWSADYLSETVRVSAWEPKKKAGSYNVLPVLAVMTSVTNKWVIRQLWRSRNEGGWSWGAECDGAAASYLRPYVSCEIGLLERLEALGRLEADERARLKALLASSTILMGSGLATVKERVEAEFGDAWIDKGPSPNRHLLQSPSYEVRAGMGRTGVNWLSLARSTFAIERGRGHVVPADKIALFTKIATGTDAVSWEVDTQTFACGRAGDTKWTLAIEGGRRNSQLASIWEKPCDE